MSCAHTKPTRERDQLWRAISGKLPGSSKSTTSTLPSSGTDIIGRGPQVTYMWKYEDMTERNTKLGSFVSDQEWKDLTDRERAEHGEITARIHNKMLAPTAYSPEPVFGLQQGPRTPHLPCGARKAGRPEPTLPRQLRPDPAQARNERSGVLD